MGDLQGRIIVNDNDNCSAHAVYYHLHAHVNSIFFPPSMSSRLQRVFIAISRSFKCAFRRVLVNHILQYADSRMNIPALEPRIFQINKALNTYDAVRLMANSYHIVPTSVVLNGWQTARRLAPFRTDEIRDIKENVLQQVKPRFKPQVGSSTLTEKAQEQQHRIIAKEKGEEWLKTRSSTPLICGYQLDIIELYADINECNR